MSQTLADLCDAIVDCEHKTAPVGDGFALSVGTRAMKNGRLVVDACKSVSEATYDAWTRRMRPVPGDLVLAREAPVGQVIRVPDDERICLGQRTVLIRPDVTQVHPRFLHYWLLGPDAQGPMAAQAGGATVPHLNVEDIRNLDVSGLPKNPRLQDFAVNALGSLDDLIENNRRRVEVLEEMARAIYREWFVHFRYPGHEDATLVDSPLGPIPEGWDVRPLGAVAELKGGSTLTKASYVESGYTAFSAAGPDGYLTDYEADGKGVVLSAVGARCGRTFRASGRWSSIANTIKILPRNDYCGPSWLYLATSDPDTWPKRGSAQPFVSINDARAVQVLVPCRETNSTFESVVGSSYDAVDLLRSSIAQAAAIRDLLLPRLVTGQIDVSSLDLDALVEGSVA